jgi:hypothetical protein
VNGRRRSPRYHVSRPFEAVFQTLRDVVLEHRDGPYLVGLSDVALRTGLSLSVDVFAGSSRQTLPVTVAESSLVIHAGTVRYRLRLAATGPCDGIDPDGLLVIDTPVRVLEMSQNGFLLEAGGQIEVGTVGLLRVDMDGAAYEGDIRAVRCTELEGSADRHRLGAEFLRTRRVPNGSPLRRAFVGLLKTTMVGSHSD